MNFVQSVTQNKLFLILCFALCLITGWMGCATAPDVKHSTLNPVVWPSPPDQPRIQFDEILKSNRDVEGKTRRNLKEILFGIDPDRLAIHLSGPIDVTTDSRNRILVTDSRTAGIHVYDRTNHTFELFGQRGQGRLKWPMGIDVDQQDNIYVADHVEKKVLKFDSNGNYIMAISGFDNPVGVAVDPIRQRLFVVDSQAHIIKVLSLDGTLIDTIGERGPKEGQFNFPTFCDVDDNGDLYVVDTGNFRIQVIDADFDVVGSVGSAGVHPGQFTRPKGITVDTQGHIFVVDGAFNNVQIFDRELRLLMPFGGEGNENGLLRLPVGIHIDQNNIIYLADFGNARLQIYRLLQGDTALTGTTTP